MPHHQEDHNLKQTVTRLMLFISPRRTTAQAERIHALQNTTWAIQTVRLLQVVLKLLMQEEQHVLPRNVAGREQQQVLAHQAEVGADTLQATAVAQEHYAPGMLQTHLAKPGHPVEQVQGIGDCRQIMK